MSISSHESNLDIFETESKELGSRIRALQACLASTTSDAEYDLNQLKLPKNQRRPLAIKTRIAAYFERVINEETDDETDFLLLECIANFRHIPIDPNIAMLIGPDSLKHMQRVEVLERIIFTSESPARTVAQLHARRPFVNAMMLMRLTRTALHRAEQTKTFGSILKNAEIMQALVTLAYEYFEHLLTTNGLSDQAGLEWVGNTIRFTEMDVLLRSGILSMLTNRDMNAGFRKEASGYVFQRLQEQYVDAVPDDAKHIRRRLVLRWCEWSDNDDSSSLKARLSFVFGAGDAQDWWRYSVMRIDESQLVYTLYEQFKRHCLAEAGADTASAASETTLVPMSSASATALTLTERLTGFLTELQRESGLEPT